ncbi:AraC family transcriptional regulator, partial [Paenibacillus sepulcri]|nr:AraC family transcriptional regulator [Paenibacillus sepulcri]
TAHLWRSLLVPEEWDRPLSVSLLSPLAHALLESFGELIGTKRSLDAPPASSNGAVLVKRAKLYIRDNLGEPLSLPDVADYLNISQRQLSRLFAGSIHESFSSFVRIERIHAIEHLLTHTDMPIKEIAERTGFSSVHYFTRVFTKAKAIPPAAFREAGRKSK